jgi:adenylate kinase
MPPFRPNISFIGPPGSGKGSYGKLLAEYLSIPLITTSDVLKQEKLDTSSGLLLDDETVSNILIRNLREYRKPPYMLDGFPRTMKQVQLQQQQHEWPKDFQVHAAISLEVPRQVCFEKLVGRRQCHICSKNWNVADVKHGKFIMPAHLPENCNEEGCSEDAWIQRGDDSNTEIINNRLDTFYETTEPIIQHFDDKNMLLRFYPYRGFDDMPRFKQALDDWMVKLEQQATKQ